MRYSEHNFLEQREVRWQSFARQIAPKNLCRAKSFGIQTPHLYAFPKETPEKNTAYLDHRCGPDYHQYDFTLLARVVFIKTSNFLL